MLLLQRAPPVRAHPRLRVFQAAAQLVVGALAPAASCDSCDWRPVFSFLCACDAAAVLCLLPVLRPWLRRVRRRACSQLSSLELGADDGLAQHDAATMDSADPGAAEEHTHEPPPASSPLPQHRI